MNSRTMFSLPPSQAERQSAESTRAPIPAKGAAPCKPRLKLTPTGKLSLIKGGDAGLSTHEVKTRIKQRYGSIRAFAERFELHYPSVLGALSKLPTAHRCAGGVAEIRKLLGLNSSPSKRGLKLASTWAQKKSTGVSA